MKEEKLTIPRWDIATIAEAVHRVADMIERVTDTMTHTEDDALKDTLCTTVITLSQMIDLLTSMGDEEEELKDA